MLECETIDRYQYRREPNCICLLAFSSGISNSWNQLRKSSHSGVCQRGPEMSLSDYAVTAEIPQDWNVDLHRCARTFLWFEKTRCLYQSLPSFTKPPMDRFFQACRHSQAENISFRSSSKFECGYVLIFTQFCKFEIRISSRQMRPFFA